MKRLDIRMYKMGTGDCFVLKFINSERKNVSIMIDGGTWSGNAKRLNKYAKDIKSFAENKLDVLIITHEHKDHVHLFDVCIKEFQKDFEIDQIWMAWTEDDSDNTVKEWKEEYGKMKKALSMASKRIVDSIADESFHDQFTGTHGMNDIINMYTDVSKGLMAFNELHFSINPAKEYTGGLTGMENVKKLLANDNIRYFKQGDEFQLPSLSGINFYVLGPPDNITSVRKEHGKKAGVDTYKHNKELKKSESFAMAFEGFSSEGDSQVFDKKFNSTNPKTKEFYEKETDAWRRIDFDWLIGGAANLALRLNSGINNLSLVLAIEFEDTGKVLLFPGDAEFGSWESWHDIDWKKKGKDGKHWTEDLLNRVVFYKVAHHLSHNGTAKEKGLDMMASDDLISMATLDFDVISTNWKSTMPNRALLKDLVEKTKGRLIVMNNEGLFYDLKDKDPLGNRLEKERKRLNSSEAQTFTENYIEHELYHQYSFKNLMS